MPKFVEVEHKFCFDTMQSFKKVESAILRLYPLRDYKVDVAERYFLIDGLNNFIIRHKVDEEKQSLTLKSFTPGKDSKTRLEVEISLAQEQGDQLQTVEKFLTVFNSYKEYKLMKHLQVFLFPEAEVVLYQAITQDRELYALEIESVKESKYEALKHIKQFELQLGLDVRKREKRCLFELLFPYG